MNRRISEQSGSGDQSVCERMLAIRKPICHGAGARRVKRRGKQAHQRTHQQQGKPHLTRCNKPPPDNSCKRAEQGRAYAHGRQSETRPETIDEEPAWNHENRVNEEEPGIDNAHLFGRDAELFHDPLVTRVRHAGTVEVVAETKCHHEHENAPADWRKRLPRGIGVRQTGVSGWLVHEAADYRPDSATRYFLMNFSLSVMPRPGPSGIEIHPSFAWSFSFVSSWRIGE